MIVYLKWNDIELYVIDGQINNLDKKSLVFLLVI